ncbi:MAG TPA: hypothetical protein VIN03_14985 [Roseateles sp.]
MNPFSVVGQYLLNERPDVLFVPWIRLEVEHSLALIPPEHNQRIRAGLWPREVVIEGIQVAVPFSADELDQPAIEGSDQIVKALDFSAVDLEHTGAV